MVHTQLTQGSLTKSIPLQKSNRCKTPVSRQHLQGIYLYCTLKRKRKSLRPNRRRGAERRWTKRKKIEKGSLRGRDRVESRGRGRAGIAGGEVVHHFRDGGFNGGNIPGGGSSRSGVGKRSNAGVRGVGGNVGSVRR